MASPAEISPGLPFLPYAGREGAGPLIMVVDDSPNVRQIVSYALKRAGYSVLEVGDGAEALEKLGSNSVSLLMTDLHMPGLDGLELINQVRALAQYRHLPIVMVTTSDTDHFRRPSSRETGPTCWIVKPFTVEQLLSVVKKVLP